MLFSCPNCGAEVVTDETTAATECVYCHSPVVLSGRLAGDMKPNLVIPFGFTEKDAKEKFYAMCKKKWFLPKDFVSDAHIDKMKGVYYPYWLVDSDKAGSCNATGKNIEHGVQAIMSIKKQRLILSQEWVILLFKSSHNQL